VLSHLADAGGGVLSHVRVGVLEAGEDGREDLGLDHHLGQVHAVLGDLAEARAHLSLELGIGRLDEWGQVCHSVGIDNSLRELWRVLANIAEC